MLDYIIFGTGGVALENYDFFLKMEASKKIKVLGFADNNQKKWGTTIKGLPVYPPDELKKLSFDYISIWSSYKAEISEQLIHELGISKSKIRDIFTDYIDMLKGVYKTNSDAEIDAFIEAMEKTNSLKIFNFEPQNKGRLYEAYYDATADLHFIEFENKKLYLKREYPFLIKDDKKWVKDIWYEQDINSPHLYEEGNVRVEEGDVLVDAGTCEGNFSLHNIDKVKKVYLLECEEEWMEALQYTFAPYKDKVVFCNKFLSDSDSDTTITLDTLVKEPVNFIKMDVEGAEIDALNGATRVLQENRNIKCSVCSYHKHGDEKKIKEILERYDFITSASKGYMLFLFDEEVLKKPEFRRGVVRGYKKESF